MKRLNCKSFYVQEKLLYEFLKLRDSEKKIIYTYSRESTIIFPFVNFIFYVYNGKHFVRFLITKDMVGFKLGEFSSTRKRFSFKKQKKIYGTKN